MVYESEIGLAMISLGMMLSLLGTVLFFEKNLLRLGNVRPEEFYATTAKEI